MEIELLIRAIIVGYVVAAPMGPVNLVCIHRTVQYGRLNGFVAGVGGAIGDGLFAAVAAFGLTSIVDLAQHYDAWLRLVGGLMLLVLGIRSLLAKPVDRRITAEDSDLPHAIAGTFLLTVTNPVTIGGFSIAFASSGIAPAVGVTGSAALVALGVLAGSIAWWATLVTLVGLFRGRLDQRALTIINRVAGTALSLFGVAALVSLVEVRF